MDYAIYLSSICFILLLGLLYSVLLLNQYKQKYDRQSSKLIQTYLNKEFITRILNIILNDYTSNEDKISILISKIKEYFDLDEVVLYHPDTPMNQRGNITFHSSIIRSYIDSNISVISNALKTKRIDVRTIQHENIYFILYIIPIESNVKVKFVIFAQSNRDGPLNSSDLEILSNPIRIILSAIFRNNTYLNI